VAQLQLGSLGKYPVVAKSLVGVLMATLVAVVYYVVWYGDVSDAIDKQRKQETSLKADLAKAQQSEFEYHKDLAELTERQQKQRELNKILPETTEYPAFLSAVQGVANVAGVQLEGWSPQEEVLQKFFARVPMKLTVEGKYHQIAKFFYGVGQLDRIINIENISLQLAKSKTDEVMLKVDCLATAFHTLPNTPAKTAEKKP
jgi:type IV pilus assembly protein PilO